MKIPILLLTVALNLSYIDAFAVHGCSSNVVTKLNHFSKMNSALLATTADAASSLQPATPASSSTPNYEDKTVEWTKPRLHNTPLFRSGFILLAIALAGYTATPASAGGAALFKLSSNFAAATHVLSFSTWFGSVAYTTFVLGITMFKQLPRKVFGRLQAKLFPKYFKIGAISILLQVRFFFRFFILQRMDASYCLTTISQFFCFSFTKIITLPSVPLFTGTRIAMNKALVVSFIATLVNLFYLEPTSTDIMLERYALEEKDGGTASDKYKSLQKSFGKFHGISSLANLIAFGGAVAHGIYISSLLAA